MYATDFEYNGVALSSFDCVICNFNGADSIEEIQAGVPLNFVTVPMRKGNKFSLTDVNYDSCIEVTFDICKDPCSNDEDDMIISDALYLALSRWLLRKEFLKLEFVNDTHVYKRYYDAVFNISKIMFNDTLYGLRLTCTTNRPYAYSDTETFEDDLSDTVVTLRCDNCLVDTITPNMVITCNAAGDLTIYNSDTESTFKINNCVSGEVITVDGENRIISSSVSSHKIWNDFNYEFLTIGVTDETSDNHITSNIACSVVITYAPIIRDAP